MGFAAAPYFRYPKEESVAGLDFSVYKPLRTVTCRSCSNHDLALDQELLVHSPRRKTKTRNLQDPECSHTDFRRYQRALEEDVFSSRSKP